MNKIQNYLYEENIYSNIESTSAASEPPGFRLPTSVLDQVSKYADRLIIEVGSWKGRSAIYMANRTVQKMPHIICVDTWLGAAEMWTKPERDEVPERYKGLNLKNGYPSLFYDFLSYVKNSGHSERITPLPNTSHIGSMILNRMEIIADVIFIDGSHDFHDVMSDLNDYWDLLSPNGIMIGDDYDWLGVWSAISKFQKQKNNWDLTIYPDTGWKISKKQRKFSFKDKLRIALRKFNVKNTPVVFYS
jgi:predicted O-methyltransferase YrrM